MYKNYVVLFHFVVISMIQWYSPLLFEVDFKPHYFVVVSFLFFFPYLIHHSMTCNQKLTSIKPLKVRIKHGLQTTISQFQGGRHHLEHWNNDNKKITIKNVLKHNIYLHRFTKTYHVDVVLWHWSAGVDWGRYKETNRPWGCISQKTVWGVVPENMYN